MTDEPMALDDEGTIINEPRPYDPKTYWVERGRVEPRVERQSTWLDTVLQDMLHELAPRTLLDVGCGDGRLIPRLPSSVEEYTGIDLSATRLLEAKRFSHGGFKRFDLVNLDFNTIDFSADDADGPWDLTVANEVLMHVPPDQLDDFVERLRFCSLRLITIDWVRPFGEGQKIASHNFLHDYDRAFYKGRIVTRVVDGLQALHVVEWS